MRRFAALLMLLSMMLLAACGDAPVRDDHEQTLSVQISAPVQSMVESTVSTYDPQQTMLSSEILDLYYYQLDAIRAGDGEAFLATFPPAYAEKLYPTRETLSEYEASFAKKSADWLEQMGQEVRLTLTVVDEQPTDRAYANQYTALLQDRYGIRATVQDTRSFTFEYSLIGASYHYTYDPVTATAILVDDHWYLPPGTTLFWTFA